MNKKINLAVAGAALALSATAANAGIVIPAGEWTLDIGGIVNNYYTSTKNSGGATVGYALLWSGAGKGDALAGGNSTERVGNFTTGLLPNYLIVSGTTRQNDLDVGFTISINPGSSTTQGGKQSSAQENRQAFLTFGDKSWGTVKVGKDLGIFASNAILNDMTLLGVGSGAGGLAGNTTTTGRIGTGFIYADWKSQISYTSPSMNGFQFTAGGTQSFNTQSLGALGYGTTDISQADAASTGRGGDMPTIEGQATYTFAADKASGKVWAGFIAGEYNGVGGNTSADRDQRAYDLGAALSIGNLNLVAYGYDGEGLGQTIQGYGAVDASGDERDSRGGYVQAKYTIPTGTVLGYSYGKSTLEKSSSEHANGMTYDLEDSMWVVGAYHPLTKHLNVVAEYSDVSSEYGTIEANGETFSVGAILFF